MRGSIAHSLEGARRGFMYSTAMSFIGLVAEIAIYVLYGSVILLTDIIHWLVDTMVEIFGFVSLYYAAKIRRKFPWGVLVIESSAMLLSILVALGVYVGLFVNYVLNEYSEGTVTTTSITPIVATMLGGVLTGITLIVQRRNYDKYKLEILKVDYTHAAIDLVSSVVTTVGIIATYITKSISVEVLFVMFSSMFIIHSLVEILRDTFRTISGSNIDYEMSKRILKILLEEFPNVDIMDVTARRIGSFYIVEIKLGVSPSEKIGFVHRLREKIASRVYRESSLIYHVDVKVYPSRKGKHKSK